MKHLDPLRSSVPENGKSLLARVTGKFYTPDVVGRRMVAEIAPFIAISAGTLRIVDPFCGDGRLLRWLLQCLYEIGVGARGVRLDVVGWELDPRAASAAAKDLTEFISSKSLSATTKWARLGRTDRDDAQREFDPASNRHTLRHRFTAP